MNKAKLVIGRLWNNPEIYTQVTDEKIEMQISLEDYHKALVAEMGSPALVMTKDGLLERMEAASERVLTEVKTASSEIV
jgi:hypothetical protein